MATFSYVWLNVPRMKTFVLTLPDHADLAPHELYAVQTALVQAMLADKRLDPAKPEHRQALEEWSAAVKATYKPPTAEESQQALTAFRRQYNWPEPSPATPVAELAEQVDKAMDELFETHGLTAETYEQWLKEGGIAGRKNTAA